MTANKLRNFVVQTAGNIVGIPEFVWRQAAVYVLVIGAKEMAIYRAVFGFVFCFLYIIFALINDLA